MNFHGMMQCGNGKFDGVHLSQFPGVFKASLEEIKYLTGCSHGIETTATKTLTEMHPLDISSGCFPATVLSVVCHENTAEQNAQVVKNVCSFF